MERKKVRDRYLTTKEVAERWAKFKVTEGKLRYWRMKKLGPKWLKIIGSVYYERKDIVNYENIVFRKRGGNKKQKTN